MGTNIFAFVVVIGVLIFFHELGHFLIARLFGVGVEKFSLGFGPRIFGKKIGITDYRISAIPLGGYVKMIGEDPEAEIDPEKVSLSFTHKHVFKRILIVAAGPLFNLLLAVVIFFAIFLISGIFILKPTVGEVKDGSPAYDAGLSKDDRIVAINDLPVESWEDMAGIIAESDGNSLEVAVKRGERRIIFHVKPERSTIQNIFGEEVERYVIGISASGDIFSKHLNPFQALEESVVQTYRITELTVVSIVKLIQGKISTKTVGGPIMIAELAGKQAKEGAANLVFFIALLSINLGVLNFLPIPVLDGGHLLFFFVELVVGRPINRRMREIAQQVGIVILILLMLYVFYNDIARLFFG